MSAFAPRSWRTSAARCGYNGQLVQVASLGPDGRLAPPSDAGVPVCRPLKMLIRQARTRQRWRSGPKVVRDDSDPRPQE